eukprot:2169973-Ditylum_brightwellii.AAC.1
MEAVLFLPPGLALLIFNTSPVPVLDGYVAYTDKCKYLGSYATLDLLDTYGIKNRAVQANKAMSSMTPHVFRNKSLSKH